MPRSASDMDTYTSLLSLGRQCHEPSGTKSSARTLQDQRSVHALCHARRVGANRPVT